MEVCHTCLEEFAPTRSTARFCSANCRLIAFRRRAAGLSTYRPMTDEIKSCTVTPQRKPDGSPGIYIEIGFTPEGLRRLRLAAKVVGEEEDAYFKRLCVDIVQTRLQELRQAGKVRV